MTLYDRRGLAVSSHNRSSLVRYEHAVELTASYFVDPLAAIDATLTDDPEFAAGHALRAALAVMSTERGALPLIESSASAIEALGARANERERAHAAAARRWLEGDFAGPSRSTARSPSIIPATSWPADAHVTDFFLGHSTLLRDRIAQVLPAWDRDVPGYGYVLGMHSFGSRKPASMTAPRTPAARRSS